MDKSFKFFWRPIRKYGKNPKRINIVTINTITDDIGVNCHVATDIFCRNFGNLNKNEIIEIWELGDDGLRIGEPIKPAGDAILPMA